MYDVYGDAMMIVISCLLRSGGGKTLGEKECLEMAFEYV